MLETGDRPGGEWAATGKLFGSDGGGPVGIGYMEKNGGRAVLGMLAGAQAGPGAHARFGSPCR